LSTTATGTTTSYRLNAEARHKGTKTRSYTSLLLVILRDFES
jgi:hypothetical protein